MRVPVPCTAVTRKVVAVVPVGDEAAEGGRAVQPKTLTDSTPFHVARVALCTKSIMIDSSSA